YEAVLMLINLYLDDNIGRDELDEHGEGTPSALCFAAGSRGEPAGDSWRHTPAGGAGEEQAVER
ncbi:MAG: hypothetical protein QXG04_02760, partial [Sulfolobales archaeon]